MYKKKEKGSKFGFHEVNAITKDLDMALRSGLQRGFIDTRKFSGMQLLEI